MIIRIGIGAEEAAIHIHIVIMERKGMIVMIDVNINMMTGTDVGHTVVIVTTTILTTGFVHRLNIIIDVNQFPHPLMLEMLCPELSAE